jgi:hypothetical protein
VTLPLPRYVIAKPLACGRVAFYFNVPIKYRALGCSIPNEPLGTDYSVACGPDGKGGRAAALNALFDEWRKAGDGEPINGLVRFGTVSWLFRELKASEAYARRVSARTRPDYERLMQLVEDQVTKKGDRVGDRPVKAITPRAADRLYARIVDGPRGQRFRQGEKVIALCRHAWNVVHRLYPDEFKILHHKTGAVVWHPLEETKNDCTVSFYEEAEAVLAKTPRHGVPVVLKPARRKKAR